MGTTYDGWKSTDTSPVDEPRCDDESVSELKPLSKRRLRVVTNSELKTARRCLREHHLAYGLGIRSTVEPEAFIDGNAIHLALASWWLAQGDVDPLQVALDELQRLDLDPYKHAKLACMLQGYHVRWIDGRKDYEVLAVEREFRTQLINPATGAPSRTYDLGGKVDVIAKDKRTGLVTLIEHKTTSEDIGAGSVYWKRLLLDSQISVYYDGARALGFPIDECLYDVLGKPQQRPFKATAQECRKYTKSGALYANQRDADETPEEYAGRILESILAEPDRYYQRGVVVRLGDEMVEARHDTWQQARLIAEADALGRHPRNPDSCMRYGRPCDYFGPCTGTASLEDPALFVRVENVHQELQEVA
jgi:hypothetical protein